MKKEDEFIRGSTKNFLGGSPKKTSFISTHMSLIHKKVIKFVNQILPKAILAQEFNGSFTFQVRFLVLLKDSS
jgi:hypothetical protein